MSSIFDWSTTASDNATADSAIGWAEGMQPSGVNNSARAMMQRVAELLKDLGGVAVAGGTANAITLATESPWDALEDGLIVTFRAAAANTDETTLNANTTSAKPIVKMTSAGETVLAGGEIQIDGIYELVYSEDLNGAAGAWLLINPSFPAISQWPTGMIGPFGGATAPDGFLACDGSAVSRTTYAALYTAIGTTWGAGDGSTTFNVPDLEDEFIRGASSTRDVGDSETDALKSHLHASGTLATSSAGAHSHSITTGLGDADGSSGNVFWRTDRAGTRTTNSAGAHVHDITGSTASTGDTETRPRNKAVLFVIKT